jgi:hypothetical protein
MKETDAWPRALDQNTVQPARLWHRVTERAPPVPRWRLSEQPPECPDEDLVACETVCQRGSEDGGVRRSQRRRGALDPKPERILLRRFASDQAEHALQVKRRPSGAPGQRAE